MRFNLQWTKIKTIPQLTLVLKPCVSDENSWKVPRNKPMNYKLNEDRNRSEIERERESC